MRMTGNTRVVSRANLPFMTAIHKRRDADGVGVLQGTAVRSSDLRSTGAETKICLEVDRCKLDGSRWSYARRAHVEIDEIVSDRCSTTLAASRVAGPGTPHSRRSPVETRPRGQTVRRLERPIRVVRPYPPEGPTRQHASGEPGTASFRQGPLAHFEAGPRHSRCGGWCATDEHLFRRAGGGDASRRRDLWVLARVRQGQRLQPWRRALQGV